MEINTEVYLKIVKQRPCLIKEIRGKFLGIQGSIKEMAAANKLNTKVDSEHEDEGEDNSKQRQKKSSTK